MYRVNSNLPSRAFLECWNAVGQHIQSEGGAAVRWIKADPYPPFLEHFSFFYGNQAYFVRIEDEAGTLEIPGSEDGLISIASAWGARACRIVMRHSPFRGWRPKYPGWGLQDTQTGRFVVPPDLVTDEKIEIGPWELFDFACQFVREDLQKKGYEILSSSRNPDVYPSMWFARARGQREWALVLPYRYPDSKPEFPEELEELNWQMKRRGFRGYLAQVGFTSITPGEPRLIRGEGADVQFEGLVPIP